MFLLITASGVQTGGHLLKRELGSDTFRFHFSKFLSTVGSIFHIFCPLEVQFFKFTSVLSQVYLIFFL